MVDALRLSVEGPGLMVKGLESRVEDGWSMGEDRWYTVEGLGWTVKG